MSNHRVKFQLKKNNNQALYKIIIFVSVIILSINGCQPSPVVTLTKTSDLERQLTATEVGLEVIDDGSPIEPFLVEYFPRGGQGLTLTGEIQLTFDQPMDAQKLLLALDLKDSEGRTIPGDITWLSPRTLQFQPSVPLMPESRYSLTITNEATSSSGLQLAEPVELDFYTVGVIDVSQVFPSDGTVDVANNAVITVVFNRPVVPLVIREDQIELPNPISITPDIPGTGEWVSTSVFAFKASKPLKGATAYSVTVNAGLEDSAKETKLVEDFIWTFTTAIPQIQSLVLGSGLENPDDNYHNLLLDEYFNINFFQPMDPDSTGKALSLTNEAGQQEELIKVWNEDFTQIVITPTERLDLQTSYTLRLAETSLAADGGKLKEGLDWHFRTVPDPGFDTVSPANGSVQENFSSELRIQFHSPMNIESVKERIEVSPKPEEEIQWWYSEWDNSIVAYFLRPSTKYQIRLAAGMEDIYGNPIDQGLIVRFTTAAQHPTAYLQMPYEPILFRSDGPHEFYAYSLNTQNVSFSLYEVSQELFMSFLTGDEQAYEYEPTGSSLVWSLVEENSAPLNQPALNSYSPTMTDGGPLHSGFYFLGMKAEGVPMYNRWLDQRLIIVASANLTFKSTATDTLIWLTDLSSGLPLEDVGIGIYDHNMEIIGDGITNEDGLLYLEIPAPDDPYSSRFAFAQGNNIFAFASSQGDSGISTWEFGIYGAYYAPANQPIAYLYTERPIYRPGQPVYFKGIVRQDDDLDYYYPENPQVTVKISNFEETVYETNLPLSDFATFSGMFTLDQETALGYYSIDAYIEEREEAIGQIGFTVAEYRRPEFRVDVSTDPLNVLSGEEFQANVKAEYYSGGNVSQAEVEWTLASERFTFIPPDEFSNYSFSDFEQDTGRLEEDENSGSEILSQGVGTTDSQGEFTVIIPADLKLSKTSLFLTFEATVTDLSNNAVSGRAQVIAHRSAVYPGTRPLSYVGEAGEEQFFGFVALDWGGGIISDQPLDIEIFERRWYSVQEQDASGRIQWKSTVEDIPIASFSDIRTDELGEAVVGFIPPNGGIFRAIVTTLDQMGNPSRSSVYMWVAGKDYIPWQQTNDRSFDLVSDRKKYSPGDTAEILIASPFQGRAYALVTVERGKIHYQDVVILETNSAIYKLSITPDMAPNAFVSVLVIKGIDETSPRPNFKLGILEIEVDRAHYEIDVKLKADPEQASPGEDVTYTVQTLDHEGQPVRAELSLGLSDLSTLSLLPSNSAPILDYFYTRRALGVWTVVLIDASIEEYNALITEEIAEGGRGGGGGGKGVGDLGVTEVRQDFPDTAFWDAHIVTNSDGLASVTVTLPDNLTTWRMDARAVDTETLVGQNNLDIISTKSLLIRPQTPRFFVAGDQVILGAAIHNNSENSLKVEVNLQGQGLTLKNAATQSIQIPAGNQAYTSWHAVIDPKSTRVDLVFSVEGGGYKDASRPTLGTLDNQGIPVFRYEAPEIVGTSGQINDAGTRIEAISLPESFRLYEGDLNVQISPSLAASMTDGLNYLMHYPYECIEQTISRFLPNVMTSKALQSAGLRDPKVDRELRDQIDIALQRLYNWQNIDGGWGWWRNDKSDPLTSAYVVLGLIEAQESGVIVSSQVLSRSLIFLRKQLSPIPRLTQSELLNRQAFLLYILARAEKPAVSNTVQIYEQRQNMAVYARAFLAQTLAIIDSGDPRVDTLLTDLNSAAIVSATGTHWEEEFADRLNWNTDTRTTAIVLATISKLDPQNPVNANAVRWLMRNRNGGHWIGTQETAWSLMGLTNWLVVSGELGANYQFGVSLNGERIGGGLVTADTLRQTTELRVDVSDLLTEEANRLVIARDAGPGNLYYTTHLKTYLPVDRITSLDQGVSINRSYYRLDDLETPVLQANQGELLLARLTLVVPSAVHYLVIDDPLPAGLEVIDQTLSTSPQSVEVPQEYSWDDIFWRGWGWWYFDHVQFKDEKVVLSTNYLPAGTYIYTYLVRAFSLGIFNTIPPTAWEFYFPDVFGRGAGSLFEVTP